jgi:acetyl esterase
MPDEARRGDPDVSPLYAADLSGLQPTVIVSAALDSLRLEADAFAERLRGAGIETELRQEPGMVHNFLRYDEVSRACAGAADRVAAHLRERLVR